MMQAKKRCTFRLRCLLSIYALRLRLLGCLMIEEIETVPLLACALNTYHSSNYNSAVF